MKILKIGKTEGVSAVSLGCMRMASLSDLETEKVIDAALESGINHFDHADIYGQGNSELKFGKYLSSHKNLRDKIFVQSKCGIHDGQYDFSKEHILKSVEGSLKRLNVDYLDMLLLHRPDTLMEPEEVAKAFDELASSGKVRTFGVSNCNLFQIELLRKYVNQHIDINQLQLSMTEAGLITSGMNVNMKNADSVMHDGGVLEYSRLINITIQTWSPMQYGFFEGVYVGNKEKFPKLNEALEKIAQQYGVAPSAIAVAWILRHPANMQVILGSMNPDRIKEMSKGADITLSRAEWYELYRSAGHTLP